MKVTDALDQIATIHEHLAKGEVYNGYRPAPVAISGVYGLLAAVLQAQFVAGDDPPSFVRYWLVVAVISALVGGSVTIFNYLLRDDDFSRRRTRMVVAQFMPCLAAGGAVTTGLFLAGPGLIRFLPGLWAVLFSLGIFSSRPYLPRTAGWVALFYLGAGFGLLCWAPEAMSMAGWGVGVTFGIGQFATALVLYRNLERETQV